jgi:transposase
MDTSKEEQRWQFAEAVRSGQWSVTELCERFGISRTTGYKWLGRIVDDGTFASYGDRSRAPATCPHRTPAALEQEVLALRARYGWGAKKLRTILPPPRGNGPRAGTINAILDRHGKPTEPPPAALASPGVVPCGPRTELVWPADFKGQFKLQTAAIIVDGHRSLQPEAPRLSRDAGDWHRRRDPRVSDPVSRSRLARRDPHRQRRPVRVARHPRPHAAQRL